MSNDLFGFEPAPSFEQGELMGPSMHVGRKCRTCGAAIVTTESGFESCARGCGKLQIPAGLEQAQIENVALPVWKK